MAVNSRELREEPKTIAVPGPDGRPIELLPPPNAFGAPRVIETPVPPGLGNAFTEAGNPRPIPADMMRKDLMPPELVAMMEGRHHRPMGGPNAPAVGPNAPPAMAMPQMPQMPQMPMQPQAPVVMQPTLPAPVRQVSGQAALELQRGVLKDSLLPSEREQAADYLSSYEAHRTPVAVAALLDGAKTDPAMMVRVACVRGLGKMRATNPEIVEALQVMTREGDERLRTACVEVLSMRRQGR